MNPAMNSVEDKMKTIMTAELKTARSKWNNIAKRDRNSVALLSIDSCNDLLINFGKSIAEELLTTFFVHLEEKDDKIKVLETKVDSLTKALDQTNNELIHTKIDMDKTNQFGRREMIRLHNIPEPTLTDGEYEDVHETVLTVLKDADIDIEPHMISSAQRLPVKKVDGKDSKTKPITFKLTRRYDRNRILRLKKTNMRENSDFQTKHKEAFMTEDLTPLRQHMAFKLRTDPNVAISWSIDGRLKCFKNGYKKGDTPITIDSPFDLGKLGYSDEDIHTIIKQSLFKKPNANV